MSAPRERPADSVRLADLLAALSMMADLGMGYPPDEAIKTCLIATSLARRLALDEATVSTVYYTALLQHAGCTAYAHEESLMFGGDEIAARGRVARRDLGNPRDLLAFFLLDLAPDEGPLRRAPVVARALSRAPGAVKELAASTCEVAAVIARRLGLGDDVQRGLRDARERWDGKGEPARLSGDEIALPARFVQVASQAVVFARLGGDDAARRVVKLRAGTALDPTIADAFWRHDRELMDELDESDAYVAAVRAEPEPRRLIPRDQLEAVARAFADAVDLKVACMRGHSQGVADLAASAARRLGLAEVEVASLRLAALFHDLGRIAVPNGTWEKPGPLGVADWERVRLHPYYTERILARSASLEPLAQTASSHHERLDGSGYPRRVAAPSLAQAARILAAADAFQAMTQARPHRPARTAEAAASEIGAEVRAGRLDGEAASAVVEAAGQKMTLRAAAPAARPAGLSDREVEVLCLVARGLPNRAVAQKLVIAPKTVDHHVQHIYAKIGVSTRAAAAMFAMEHRLLEA